VASDEAERQFKKKAEPQAFLPDQLVLLDEHSFLAKIQKLAPKWSGPHKILRLKGDCNVELLLRHNNKKLITHVNRLKPYFVQKPAAVSLPDFFPAEKSATPPPIVTQQEANEEIFIDDELFPYEQEVTSTDPSNFRAARPMQQRARRQTFSSSSSAYGDSPEVSVSDPSPAVQPT
jgi:hypothetical protein